MMKSSFSRALASQFSRLGQEATYVNHQGDRYALLVMAHRPEQLFGLGAGELHAEDPQLAFIKSEQLVPRRGECIRIDDCTYRIVAEPRLDLHQLIWYVDCVRQLEAAC